MKKRSFQFVTAVSGSIMLTMSCWYQRIDGNSRVRERKNWTFPTNQPSIHIFHVCGQLINWRIDLASVHFLVSLIDSSTMDVINRLSPTTEKKKTNWLYCKKNGSSEMRWQLYVLSTNAMAIRIPCELQTNIRYNEIHSYIWLQSI